MIKVMNLIPKENENMNDDLNSPIQIEKINNLEEEKENKEENKKEEEKEITEEKPLENNEQIIDVKWRRCY